MVEYHRVMTHGDHIAYVRLVDLTIGTYFFPRVLLTRCGLTQTIPNLDLRTPRELGKYHCLCALLDGVLALLSTYHHSWVSSLH